MAQRSLVDPSCEALGQIHILPEPLQDGKPYSVKILKSIEFKRLALIHQKGNRSLAKRRFCDSYFLGQEHQVLEKDTDRWYQRPVRMS